MKRLLSPASIVIGVVVLFLLSPKYVPPDAKRPLARHTTIAGPLGFPWNIDSLSLIRLADEPSGLFEKTCVWQTRPLYPLLGAVLSLPTDPILRIVRPRYLEWPGREYFGYLLLHFVVLIAAVALFQHLLAGFSEPFIPIVLCVAFVANDVVKAFFWTPHMQMFGVLMPVFCMVVCRAILERPLLPIWKMSVIGLLSGMLFLCYGSYLVVLGGIGLALAIRGRGQKESWIGGLFGRAGAASAGFVMPALLWVITLLAITGAFHSNEISRYRQFVWILDSADHGPGGVIDRLGHHLYQFVGTLWPVLWFPVLLLLGTLMVASASRLRLRSFDDRSRTTLTSAGIACFVNLVFFGLMGFYSYRLTWSFVPILLVVTGVIAMETERRLAGRRLLVFRAYLSVAAASWLVFEVVKYGPHY